MQLLGGLLQAALLRCHPEIPQVMIIQPFHAIYIIRLNLRVNEKLRISGRCAHDRCSPQRNIRRRAVPGGTAQGGGREQKERTMTLMILFIGTLALSLFAAARVKSVYNRFSRGSVLSGRTGAEAAALILNQAGIRDVEIAHHDEVLGDHYDPLRKRLVLSSQNYFGSSPAALGVAAHEADMPSSTPAPTNRCTGAWRRWASPPTPAKLSCGCPCWACSPD